MGVYIPNAEMPKRCGECHIGFCEQIGCDLYIGFVAYQTRRHPNCPLIEVREHGDLIDRDVFIKNIRESFAEAAEEREAYITIANFKFATRIRDGFIEGINQEQAVIPASEVQDG